LTEYGYATTFSDEVFIIAHHPVAAKTNPLGIMGCGEAGCADAVASVMNAIVGAMSPCAIRRIDMQATPERVWQAIRRAPSAPAL
jgi:aerobic carbon-monoxide dehydrogenase large subunit